MITQLHDKLWDMQVLSAGSHTNTGSNGVCHVSHFRKGLPTLVLKQTMAHKIQQTINGGVGQNLAERLKITCV